MIKITLILKFVYLIVLKNLDLISKKNILKNISCHQSCKCGCLLDENVCNNLQKWNKKKSRCECLKRKKCDTGYSWYVNNCRCEMKKLAALIETETCGIETDEIESLSKNKRITLIEKVKNCKPFIDVSILFLCVSVILIGVMI